MATYHSPFAIGDRVMIDGDREISGTVIAVCWSSENPEIKVSRYQAGVCYDLWFAPWRLKAVEAD